MSEIKEKLLIICILGLCDSGKKDILDYYFHNEFNEIKYFYGTFFLTIFLNLME